MSGLFEYEHAVVVAIGEMQRHVPERVAVEVLGRFDQGRGQPGWDGPRCTKLRTSKTAVALVMETRGGPVVGVDVAIRQQSDEPSGGEVVAVARYVEGQLVECHELTPAEAAARGIEFAPEDDERPGSST